MCSAKQHDPIRVHIESVRPNSSSNRRGDGKNDRGRGMKTCRANEKLWHLQPARPSAPLSARPLAQAPSSVDTNNTGRLMGRLHPRRPPVASRVPLPPKGVVVAGGTASNALCASLRWWCPHPTRCRPRAGATFTRRFGATDSSLPPGISRLCRLC